MKNKIRLMQITHDLDIGGLQQVVVNLCKFIDKEKFNVSVLCLRALGPFTEEVRNMGIKVHFLPQPQHGTDYFSFLKVAKILRKEKIDVIHTHNTQPFLDGTLGALLSGRKITIVHTDHGRIFPDKKRYMLAERIMSHFSYKIVAVSKDTASKLLLFERIPSKKLTVINNGIDCERYNVGVDKEEKRKELGIARACPVIGVVARLSKEKGIVYLVRAMKYVIESFPNATLLVVGDGPFKDNLIAESVSLGIVDKVLFTGSRADIPQVLKVLDVFVLPSLSEGLPMVLLEAMAAGCPIVATDVGGIKEALKTYQCGAIVRSGDSLKLAGGIIQVLNQIAINNNFRPYCSISNKEFSARYMVSKYQRLYSRMS